MTAAAKYAELSESLAAKGDDSYVVSWGMGGESRTLTGLNWDQARDACAVFSAWGPVKMRVIDGQLIYMDNGMPVAEGNATRRYVMSLMARKVRVYRGHDDALGVVLCGVHAPEVTEDPGLAAHLRLCPDAGNGTRVCSPMAMPDSARCARC